MKNSLLSNEEKVKWTEDYVERDTAVARMRVEDAEAAIRQGQAGTGTAENPGLMNREPKQTLEEMMAAIGDSVSDLASCGNGEDGEDEQDAKTEQGKLSEDDEPGWVMGAIAKMVPQCIKRFWQKWMKLDKLTPPGWGDAADYSGEREKKYITSELNVPAVVKQQTDDDVAALTTTTFGELLECLNIVPGIMQMPQGTSQPRSSYIRIGSGKKLSDTDIASLVPAGEPDSSLIQNAKLVEIVSFTLAYSLSS